jgi:hypothetical protein
MVFFSAAEIISIIGFIMKAYLLICPARRKRNENEPDLEQNLDMHACAIYFYVRLPSTSFFKNILLLKIDEIYMFIQFVDPCKLLALTSGMYIRGYGHSRHGDEI